jgi:hypothetical protein
MKIYIAARFEKREEIRELHRMLEARGHEISGDWTTHRPIKPYEAHPELAEQYAVEDIDGVKKSDVFILLTDEAGTGMYVELGAALFSNSKTGKPKIYVVGGSLTSVFHFHPAVNRRASIQAVLDEIRSP